MANKRILVIGSANMDLSLNMYKLPEAGETLIDDGGVAYIPGGKGHVSDLHMLDDVQYAAVQLHHAFNGGSVGMLIL